MESLRLGTTICDFIEPPLFYTMCEKWLKSDHFHHVVTLNPEMVLRASRDERFRSAIDQATIRVPDGSGLIWARWYLRSAFWPLLPSLAGFFFHSSRRIMGVEVVYELSRMASEHDISVYLLGGTTHEVSSTAAYLVKKFPHLEVHFSANHNFDIAGPSKILADIQEKRPSILFVAYGAPKQAMWIARNRGRLPSVRIAVGVGGAFAMLGEQKPRAPQFLRQHNIEWLWRLLLEPTRFPRIWRSVIDFPLFIRNQKKKEEK